MFTTRIQFRIFCLETKQHNLHGTPCTLRTFTLGRFRCSLLFTQLPQITCNVTSKKILFVCFSVPSVFTFMRSIIVSFQQNDQRLVKKHFDMELDCVEISIRAFLKRTFNFKTRYLTHDFDEAAHYPTT